MDKPPPTTPEPQTNRTWEHLEDFVREHVQGFIQALLEEEVTELLRRTKSARREPVDAAQGYRNGYGKPRRLTPGACVSVIAPVGRHRLTGRPGDSPRRRR